MYLFYFFCYIVAAMGLLCYSSLPGDDEEEHGGMDFENTLGSHGIH